VRPAAFRPLGFSRQKAASLIARARACMDNQIDFEKLNHLSDAAAAEELARLRGIGRWSAEYALLRGLG
jgi:DNA-3-methyladenine glycosylase II